MEKYKLILNYLQRLNERGFNLSGVIMDLENVLDFAGSSEPSEGFIEAWLSTSYKPSVKDK